MTLNANNISTIFIKRKGRVWRSALTGMTISAAAGAIINEADNSWLDTGSVVVGFGVAGGAIGALIGTGSMKFEIHGNKDTLKNLGLEAYAIFKR
ncbi:hypothetical protein [Seonamhaeicola maritimus]|uniref:Uncharacterized protein n=1 Tax=Seonamhaeicola maritimus TaxID=2591822 RepID=A0A5C7GKL4_9FLAO|nr:hypothetical protein [Seonamhaeicola maritimus]TXG38657.1 hypothetical protein FUA22_01885 [Seonamhaeicola maritimus]